MILLATEVLCMGDLHRINELKLGGLLRKACTDWWIRFFKYLRHKGLYNDDNVIHRECLKFCFMDILQTELHGVARDWNIHRIWPSRNGESPPGRPDVLYFNPSGRISNYLVSVLVRTRYCQ